MPPPTDLNSKKFRSEERTWKANSQKEEKINITHLLVGRYYASPNNRRHIYNLQSVETSNDRENNSVGYAEDTASEYADRIFHKTGHQIRREAGKLIEKKKDKASGSSTSEEPVYQPKEQIRPYRLQAEKRHRSREKNLLSKKSRPLNGIKEPSRPGEHRNRL